MKIDIVYILLAITLAMLIYAVFHRPVKQVIVKEVVEETPVPYWTYIFPNYWERYPRDNTYYNPYYYDPYLSYPYSIGPWWYGSYGYSGGGYSGGIRTGGHGGGHHGGGGHGGGGQGGGGHGGH